ncbi:ATP-binding cassette transporter 1 [Hyaloraphidium curvatum]|nr:ATP-binding cassette transporter 1 [Hyaloraphidium curvatum]
MLHELLLLDSAVPIGELVTKFLRTPLLGIVGICGSSPDGFGPFAPLERVDFTPCFEGSVLAGIPRLLLLAWLAAVLVSKLVRGGNWADEDAVRTRTWLWWGKLASNGMLAAAWAFSVAQLVILSARSPDPYELLDALGGLAMAMIVLPLSLLHHRRRLQTSTELILYHLAALVMLAIQLRTSTMIGLADRDPGRFAALCLVLLAVLICFAFENVPKDNLAYIRLAGEAEESAGPQSPEEAASIWSRLFFAWLNPLMALGYSKGFLEPADLPPLSHDDQAHTLSKAFASAWEQELKLNGHDASLARASFRVVGWYFMSAAPFKFAQDCLGFLQPLLLRYLIEFARSHAPGRPESRPEPQPVMLGIVIASTMLVAAVVQSCVLHQYFQISFMTGFRLRVALFTQIYRKALRLSPTARGKSSVGEVVNLMAVDAQRINDLFTYLHMIWSGVFQIVLAMLLLYSTLGYPVFAGVAVMVVAIPLNAWLARVSRAIQKTTMGTRDERVKLMDEVLGSIRTIKLYAWEPNFRERIDAVRERELSNTRRYAMLGALQSGIYAATPFLVAFSTFCVHALARSQVPLTSSRIFVSLALFNLLQFPLSMLPSVISSTVEASVAFERLHGFLTSEELDPAAVTLEPYPKGAEDETAANGTSLDLVVVRNGSFRWASRADAALAGGPAAAFGLNSIDFICGQGRLVSLTGPVGCGKSSFLSAILGEMTKVSGTVVVRGTVAYAAQDPWIMNATLRENVIFGREFDRTWYDIVIEACALLPDLQVLPGGDMVEIGERGIGLSGGTRARVALARAVYSRADLYLLDDTLSAVDAHVARHLFSKVIGPQGLLRDKTRVLVTHSVSFLPLTDEVYLFEEGRVVESGSFESLMRQEGELFHLIQDFGFGRDVDDAQEEEVPAAGTVSAENGSPGPGVAKTGTRASDSGNKAQGKSMVKETSARGAVASSVYRIYAEACGIAAVAVYLAIVGLTQATSVAQTFWLADWSRESDVESPAMTSIFFAQAVSAVRRLGVYGALGLIFCSATFVQNIFGWAACAIPAGRKLHSLMLDTVLRAPQSFFDTTSLGALVNRFSRDQVTVDETIPRSFMGFWTTFSRVASILVVNAIVTPLFIVFVLPLGVIYGLVSRYYLATSRELKRLDSVSRSPIFASFGETLSGLSTIRAFREADRFGLQNEALVDANSGAYAPSITSNRWLAMRLELLGSMIIFGSAAFAVAAIATGSPLSASMVGLTMSFSLSVTQSLNWLVRQSSELETNIVSVERVKEYIDLPREAPDIIDGHRPPASWPSEGHIVFKDFSARYRPNLDLCLERIDLQISAGQKVGLCGRTGSGKSSLAMSLFRIFEAAEGRIEIDGLDIATIGLRDLRGSHLTVVPQSGTVFLGSIRSNLDPFSEHDDASLWRALEASSLKDHVSSLEGGLDAPVHNGGGNLSVGQRQLLSLARALLRKTRILVLDEASSSVDIATDSQIVATIRREFSSATVLTIAHRLHTIVECDKIIVLDRGQIAEVGTPAELVQRDGFFRRLIEDSGESAPALVKMALAARSAAG